MTADELAPGFRAALRGSILRIRDKYFLWSSIADAPLTVGMSRADFALWYHENVEEGAQMARIECRLDRADKGGELGTSCFDGDAFTTIICNRAGPDGTKLTMEEIYNLAQ